MQTMAKIVIFITLALWPLSLLLTNSFRDFRSFPSRYAEHSIFAPDKEALLIINNKRSVYQSDLLGRFFNNKAAFILGRFKSNFFALIDPNNYFFGFHPREIVRENLNIEKFPFIAIVFLLFGLVNINKMKHGKKLLALLFVTISLLSLVNFDVFDFALYPILASFMIFGVNQMKKEKPTEFLAASLFLIIFAIPQYLRIFINLHP